MSKTVDERVVSLQLDNKNLESNAKTSMSTLDKLKDKLNFKGAAKGADTLGAAVKKVDMNGLGRGVTDVHAKFSALEVIGVTALSNITNSAVNCGKRMLAALTITPVSTGFSEYETQINATQTILANVGHKGKTLEDVNAALEQLNTYADQTIYNFTEMTKNIGLFTNAGVGLDESVSAIKGFSNAAAMAGTDATRTAGAMYQLSQAMSSGAVRLQDWRSLEQANITGERFQETIKETARAHGINVDAMIKKEGSLRETLKSGWLTADLMSEALNHYTLSTETMTKAEQEAAKAKMKSNGYTDEQIEKLFQLGTEATNAATQVKTFSQLWGVLTESAQSGWSKTWKILIGDFDQAKSLLTPLADTLTGFINKTSEWRNNLLESALGKTLLSTMDKFNTSLSTVKNGVNGVLDPVKNVAKSLESLDAIADKVIVGTFGNGADRYKALTEAGQNYYEIQNKVNEKLGDSHRYSEKQIQRQNELLGTQTKTTEKTKEQTDAVTTLTDEDKKRLKVLTSMSEEQLKNEGYTQEQIDALKDLCEQAEKLGYPLEEFIDNLDKINGRTLLLKGFSNIGETLKTVFTSIGKAWKSIFNPDSSDDADMIFNLITGFTELTAKIKNVVGDGKTLTRTFKGIFAAIDMVLTVVSAPFKIAFKLLNAVLAEFDMNILDLTAKIGDAMVKFSKWVKSLIDVDAIVAKVSSGIKGFVEDFKAWIAELKTSDNIPRDIIKGLVSGLSKGASAVFDAIIELGNGLIEKFKALLGIHSPSTVFADIGGYIVGGLVDGIKFSFSAVWDLVKALITKLIDFFKEADLGKIMAVAVGGGLLMVVMKVVKLLNTTITPIAELGATLKSTIENLGKSLQGYIKAKKMEAYANSFLAVAKAIAVLAISVFLLSKIEPGRLWTAVLALTALAGVIVLLGIAANKLEQGKKINLSMLTIVGIALALQMLARVVTILGKVDVDKIPTIIGMFILISGGLIGMLAAIAGISKIADEKQIDALSRTMIKLSASLLIMAIAIKIMGNLSIQEAIAGGLVIAAFTSIIVGLMAISKLTGTGVDGLGKGILKISLAMVVMILVMKLVAKMEPEEITKGLIAITIFSLIIVGLMAMSKLLGGGGEVAKMGTSLLMMASAMIIMALVVRLVGGMDVGALAKGLICIGLFGGLMVALMYATKSSDGIKAGIELMAMAVAIGILAAIAVALSLIKLTGLAKGLVAIGLVSGLMIGIIYATKGVESSIKNLIAMAVAISILAGVVLILSFLDPAKVLPATLALAVIMGAFALLILSTKTMGDVKSIVGPLLLLTGVVVVLAAIIAVLSRCNPEAAIGSTIALVALTAGMVAVCAVLGLIGKFASNMMPGILALTLMALPMLAFVGILALMSNVQNATTNALTLVMLMTVCALLLPILALVGVMWIPAAIGILALTAMAVPMLAFVGVLAVMQNIQNATENVNLLIGLITTLAGVLLILAPIAPLAVIGVTALSMLTLLMVQVGAMAIAIGALMTKFPVLQEFLNAGLPVMIQLAGAIGQMIGAFVGGIATQIANALPNIAMQMSLFMTNIQPFVNGAKLIDASVLAGVAILAASVIALCAADLIAGITSFLTGGTSFAELGTQLSLFMTNAMPFVLGSKMIDPSIMEGVKTLAEAILILTGANLMEQITSWLGGEGSLATFGSQLGDLGTNLSTFVTNLGTFSAEQVATVQCACDAIKALADAAGEIPNDGGLAGFFAGENSIDVFGAKLPGLGTHLAQFVANLGTFTDAQVTTVGSAGEAIKLLSEAAGEIPNDGGMAAFFAGENSIDKFGNKLPSLGTHIANFVTNLGTFTEAQVGTVDCAGRAISALASAAADVPNDGGVAGWFAGENSIDKFGNKLPGLGTNLKNFVKNLGTFTSEQVSTVDSAVKALNTFAKLGGKKVDPDNVSAMGTAMKSLGTKLKSFCTSVNGIGSDSIESAVSGLNKMINAVKKLGGKDSEAVKSVSDSLKTLGESGLKKFTEAFSGDDASTKVKAAATAMITTLTSGIDDKIESVKTKAGEVASAVTGKLTAKKFKESVTDAGKNVATGFANGIKNNKYLASDAGSALGKAALKAAKEALDENSPSKEMYKIGEFAGVGYVNALYDYVAIADRAGSDIAKSSLDGLKGSLSRISDLMMNDIDSEPTIRPVLDLSAVESGARSIGGMFSGSTLAVNAKAGTVSAMMRGYQNGRNSDELASQIKGLRKDLNNAPHNTYSINGITVEEGSSAAGAIKELIRYVKVEGRA